MPNKAIILPISTETGAGTMAASFGAERRRLERFMGTREDNLGPVQVSSLVRDIKEG